MKPNTKHHSFKRPKSKQTSRLKTLLRLWSRQTLTSLPERLSNLWQQLMSSYWFIPTACVLVGILLAPLFVFIDQQFDRETINEVTFAFTGDDDAARAIMTAIAGAVLGVAGTTFSITIAVLSMASSQFGPRLLRNFLTDTPNQFVLGAFIGTFSYSLLVLKAIHKRDVFFGVPQLAVTFAIIMAIICALLLVYFVQHMVHAIQASHVIQGASNDAIKNIKYWYTEHCDLQHQQDITHPDVQNYHNWPATVIYAPSSGYLQHIYIESLITLAHDYGGVVQLHSTLGAFITDNNVIGYFYQRPDSHKSHVRKTKTPYLAVRSRAPDGVFWQRLASSMHFESRPIYSNDIEYSLGQMTEVAVRALSPGINDPKTAVNCVQSLTVCLSTMMRRQPPSPYHFHILHPDADTTDTTLSLSQQRLAILAVITNIPQISEFMDISLGEIRRYATADLMVLKALCQAMTNLSFSCVNNAQYQILLHELILIERAGIENLSYAELVNDLQAMCKQARHFIQNNKDHHHHFEYVSEFSASIHHTLQSQSS